MIEEGGEILIGLCLSITLKSPAVDPNQISFSYFTSKDVVRHPLVAAIIEAYEKDDPK